MECVNSSNKLKLFLEKKKTTYIERKIRHQTYIRIIRKT